MSLGRIKCHEVSLKRSRDKSGRVIQGLWEGDIVRMEAVDDAWECQVTVRAIGRSQFYEFRPHAMGGTFRTVGRYRTLDDCCVVAEKMQAGTHVLRPAYKDSLGKVPAMVVEWTSVSEEIAQAAN